MRWRPETALIHELQHRKTQGCQDALESSTQGLQVRAQLVTGLSGVEGSEMAWGKYGVGWQLLSSAPFSVHAWWPPWTHSR